MGVTMPSGEVAEIELIGSDVAKKTLGVYICPIGNILIQIKNMLDASQKWNDRARKSKLQRRDIWFLPDHHLWPKLGH
jgi:hypothetical protein